MRVGFISRQAFADTPATVVVEDCGEACSLKALGKVVKVMSNQSGQLGNLRSPLLISYKD